MLNVDDVERRIDELKDARERFIVQANLELASFSARIDELEHLLQPAPASEEAPAQ